MPMTLDEIDELLALANAVPMPKRGAAWDAHVDALLDQRQQVEQHATG